MKKIITIILSIALMSVSCLAYADKSFFDEICAYNNSLTEGSKPEKPNGNIEFVDFEGNVIINKEDIISVTSKKHNMEYCIELTFSDDCRKKFAESTKSISQKQNGENYIAIIVNGEVISVPTVVSEIDSEVCIISGCFTKETANNLVNLILGK